MAPTPTPVAKSGKVYLRSAKYVPSPKPGRVHFNWKYDSKSADAFSVWFYNVQTHKYTVVRPSWSTRVQGNGGGSGQVTNDRLVGVAGVYTLILAAEASGYDATTPTKVYGTSSEFHVKITDFET
ncbi:hypothetical protein M407DRAFT_242471 [Tulasnella calospora MUT 4182]|uniref:Uncharacterized protein n=1 Tax=Tulasnella calospora MUT 4182 TaxID=1051891 RepID=A0A0C3QQG7_9AGAM|nr:hypothetical protein M407DRAFT_242471 [Tulasnella calospora MUT 4182]